MQREEELHGLSLGAIAECGTATSPGPANARPSEWTKEDSFELSPEFRQGFWPGVEMTMRCVFSWLRKDYDKKRSGGSNCLLP